MILIDRPPTAPHKVPVFVTRKGEFVELTDALIAIRDLMPDRLNDVRQTPEHTYPAPADPDARAFYDLIKRTFTGDSDFPPAEVADMEQAFRAQFGRYFPAENYALCARELGPEPVADLITFRQRLIADLDAYRAGHFLDRVAPTEHAPRPDELALAQSMFFFNLAVLYRRERNAEAGLATMAESLREFSDFVAYAYQAEPHRLDKRLKIMLVDRMISRAGFLRMAGEIAASETALADAHALDADVFRELMEHKAPKVYPELYKELP